MAYRAVVAWPGGGAARRSLRPPRARTPLPDWFESGNRRRRKSHPGGSGAAVGDLMSTSPLRRRPAIASRRRPLTEESRMPTARDIALRIIETYRTGVGLAPVRDEVNGVLAAYQVQQ